MKNNGKRKLPLNTIEEEEGKEEGQFSNSTGFSSAFRSKKLKLFDKHPRNTYSDDEENKDSSSMNTFNKASFKPSTSKLELKPPQSSKFNSTPQHFTNNQSSKITAPRFQEDHFNDDENDDDENDPFSRMLRMVSKKPPPKKREHPLPFK